MNAEDGHGEKQSRKMGQAAVALLTERTFEEAAKSVGISKATLQRWSKKPEFRALFSEALRDLRDESIGRLAAARIRAIETLESNLQAEASGTQVRAAIAILDRADMALDGLLVDERLTALEQRLGIDVTSTESGPGSRE